MGSAAKFWFSDRQELRKWKQNNGFFGNPRVSVQKQNGRRNHQSTAAFCQNERAVIFYVRAEMIFCLKNLIISVESEGCHLKPANVVAGLWTRGPRIMSLEHDRSLKYKGWRSD